MFKPFSAAEYATFDNGLVTITTNRYWLRHVTDYIVTKRLWIIVHCKSSL